MGGTVEESQGEIGSRLRFWRRNVDGSSESGSPYVLGNAYRHSLGRQRNPMRVRGSCSESAMRQATSNKRTAEDRTAQKLRSSVDQLSDEGP